MGGRPKREKPEHMDPLTMSPMFLDEETNAAVAEYKGVVTYSFYVKD